MSNWCLGCHNEIPDGDLCSMCNSLLTDQEKRDMGLLWTPTNEEEIHRAMERLIDDPNIPF